MTVLQLPVRGQWAWDVRGEGRAARISAHAEEGLVNLSVWRHDTCVGTVRLSPDEVANLVAGLTEGLAELTRRSAGHGPADAERIQAMEERIRRLESRPSRWGMFAVRAREAFRSRRGSGPSREHTRPARDT